MFRKTRLAQVALALVAALLLTAGTGCDWRQTLGQLLGDGSVKVVRIAE